VFFLSGIPVAPSGGMARFRSIFSQLLFLSILLCAVHGTEAASLVIAWDAVSDPSVAGYAVNYGTQSQTYTAKVNTGSSTAVTISGLAEATVYYVAVQSYDNKGAVGPLSSEVVGQTGLSAPSISCPSPVLTSPDGNPVAVTLLAVSSGGVLPVTIGCTPASGSLFKVGTTPFTCTATDAVKQTASCSSTVSVLAPVAPVQTLTPLTISCPSISTFTAPGKSGKATVTFADPVVSGGMLPVSTSCSPASGTQFQVGTTSVSCKAVDAMNQVASCTTSATVLESNPGKK
jgi:hypothetical protein